MYRRILVPTDFSESAEKAVSHALALARAVDAEVVLFHAFVRPMMPSVPAGNRALRQFLDEAAGAVKEQLEELAAGCEGVRCRPLTVEGRPSDEIIAAALAEDCDLICMSAHGHGGLAKVLVGSVAERVIQRAPCPVLVIRVAKQKRRRNRKSKRQRQAAARAAIRVDEDGD